MARHPDEMQDWTRYPTFGAYCQMMENWAADHSGIATLVETGRSALGRPILAMRITAPGDTSARMPILLSSTIHGNETTGYMLSLRLIDSLLLNYKAGDNSLLDRAILYILPLANPDGTYTSGDTIIRRPTRENANGIDLNRNFPIRSAEPDPAVQQSETAAIMRLAISRKFAFSVAFHSGDEVVNFPWDSYRRDQRPLPDISWWTSLSREYVNSVRQYDNGYMRTVNNDGYVFGSDWYLISGGMQDWMYSQMRCRETTIELSAAHTTPPEKAAQYWNICHGAVTRFIYRALEGFSGSVTDNLGNPIEGAQIIITAHDEDCSSVMTNKLGNYFRPTLPGQCIEACAVASGYGTQCQTIVTGDMESQKADFVLFPEAAQPEGNTGEQGISCIISADGEITVDCPEPVESVQIASINGATVLYDQPNKCQLRYSTHNLKAGIYVIRIKYSNNYKTQKIVIAK